jgi:hypothetical protein
MRHPLLLVGVLLLLPPAARAQVTIDLRALEALPQAPPAPSPRPRPVLRVVPSGPAATAALPVPPVQPDASPAPAPATTASSGGQMMAVAGGPTPPTAPTPRTPASPTTLTPMPPAVPAPTAPVPPGATASLTPPPAATGSLAPPPTAPASPVPPPATLPSAAPPLAVLAPIPPPVVPPAAKPPEPPPVSATAATTVVPAPSGLRLIFQSTESDLSPAASGAVSDLVKSTPKGDSVTYNVVAYAAGVADDPSIARRMSLSRGLSVRAALLADGVASTHIYIRALGAEGGDAPADRVDLTVLGLSGAPAGGAAKP